MAGIYEHDIYNNYSEDTSHRCNNNFTYRITNDDLFFLIYYFSFMFIISVIGLVGNGIVIHCVIFRRNLRIPVNYYLFSLACSDFLLCVIYPIYNVSHLEDCAIIDTLGRYIYCIYI